MVTTPILLAHSPYYFISSICLVHINVFAKFDEIPSMILQYINETKRYRHDTSTRRTYCKLNEQLSPKNWPLLYLNINRYKLASLKKIPIEGFAVATAYDDDVSQ